MGSEDTERKRRPTMSMEEAAELVGLHIDTVRAWIDAHEAPGQEPVAARNRDDQGRARPGSWRRPYRDAVQAWARQRAGGGAGSPGGVDAE